MTREELREQLLKYYDVKTIVDCLFWNPDREKFLKELSDYQRSILERFFNPNKRLFQAYLKEQTLPYEEWNHYKRVLNRAISLKENIISRLFQRIESEKEKRKKIVKAVKEDIMSSLLRNAGNEKEIKKNVAKPRRTAIYDDANLLTRAFLLFLLYEVLNDSNNANGTTIEKPENLQKMYNEGNTQEQQESQSQPEKEQTKQTEITELKSDQIDTENTAELDSRHFEDNTMLPDKMDLEHSGLEQNDTESLKNFDDGINSDYGRDYDSFDSFGSFDSGDSYNSGSNWDSSSDWSGGGDW